MLSAHCGQRKEVLVMRIVRVLVILLSVAGMCFLMFGCVTPGAKDFKQALEVNTLSGYADFVNKWEDKTSAKNVDEAIVRFWQLYGPRMGKVRLMAVTDNPPPISFIPSLLSEVNDCLRKSVYPLVVANSEPGQLTLATHPRFGDMERAYFDWRGEPWLTGLLPQVSQHLQPASMAEETNAKEPASVLGYVVFYSCKHWYTTHSPDRQNWCLTVVLVPPEGVQMHLELLPLHSGKTGPPSSAEEIISTIDWDAFAVACRMLRSGAAAKMSSEGTKIS